MPRAVPAAPVLTAKGQISLTALTGIGPAKLEKLKARHIVCMQDLWLWLPTSYEDRTRLTPIASLQAGVAAQIEGTIRSVHISFNSRPMLCVHVHNEQDRSASVILRFFNFYPVQAQQFSPGGHLRCYGTPRYGLQGLELIHPSYWLFKSGHAPALENSLTPVYPVIEGIGPMTLRRIVAQALAYLPDEAELELVPPHYLDSLPSLRDALLTLHCPPADSNVEWFSMGRHPAQQRLALEELLAHHLSYCQQRLKRQQQHAYVLPQHGQRVEKLLRALPFQLTTSQQRVFEEICADLAKPQPMLRLLQGDVGCGKTIVAVLTALLAVDDGKQVALLTPTELLAEQHLFNLRLWLEKLDVRLALLTSKLTGSARQQILDELAAGSIQIMIGTHALMQPSVVFHDLALVIVDEQHRFGVQQRLTLRDKGVQGQHIPHQLMMTATPIPRTLSMIARTDLDISTINELPPGRQPVQTALISASRRDHLIERIRLACLQGRQAYWVCTLIDESEDIIANAAHTTWQELSACLPELSIGLLHGRMKAAEKQAIMAAFKDGQIHLLVATTVIEVGVDVPNASLMIIDNPERLGLAQLHQLRGRVGRGAAASHCVLLYQPPLSTIAKARLQTLRQTADGFEIAEKDLELRGPGEVLGTRQTGVAQFRIADLQRDTELLPHIPSLAQQLLMETPQHAEALISRWIGTAIRYASA